MTLLSWPTALWLAAITIPLLLLLYFLKLRRQERRISSTLLWKKAVQDLQVNAPFQRLRRNLLLILQLLILAVILAAIANPVVNLLKQPGENLVLLIDRSGSMKTRETDGRTRLEQARQAAQDRIRNLPADTRAMVISFADRAEVVCSFTTDRRRLLQSVEDIRPTDARTRIAEALQLAVAYSSNMVDLPGGGGPQNALRGGANIEMFSDGQISDAAEPYLTRGTLTYRRIGASTNNVGITAFGVRRDYERPGMLSALASIQNFGPQPVTLDVTLSVNGRRPSGPGSIQEITLGPGTTPTTQNNGGTPSANAVPSQQNILFELLHEEGGTIEIRLHHEDAWPIDNVAIAPIDPPRQIRALVVSERTRLLALLLRGLDAIGVQQVATMSGQEYESAADAKLIADGRALYDLVIFDQHNTNRLPPGNYLFFGGLPQLPDVGRGDEITGQSIVLWKDNHPLTRWVPFNRVYLAKWSRLTLPTHALPLVEGEDSTIIAFLTDPGHRYIISAFDLDESNFLLEPACAIFLQNAAMYLAGSGLIESSRLISPGETLNFPVPRAATEARVTRANGENEALAATDRNTLTYAGTHDAGIYKVAFNDPARTREIFAANILDATESHIAPLDKISIGSEQIAAATGPTRVNEPLWPWLALGALMLVLLEWWIYNRRVMI